MVGETDTPATLMQCVNCCRPLPSVRTKCLTGTEHREMNCADAGLEKSFPLEAVSKVCRGKDAGKGHSRQRPEQRQGMFRERRKRCGQSLGSRSRGGEE